MPASPFRLTTTMQPAGDQPRVIAELVEGYRQGRDCQCLLGVTGSGKTFTMAHVIAALGLPTLVLSHNKTLAAQLYSEFRDFFQENAVEYFVSYYDYYQPEAYLPQRDIYIEKDAAINDDLDRLRLATTSSLRTRRDVIVVSSVSCIYGLGDPEDYSFMVLPLVVGEEAHRETLLRRLVDMLYERGEFDFRRGRFRVRGDVIEIFPAYEDRAYRVELDDDRVVRLEQVDVLTGEVQAVLDRLTIFPAKHFAMPEERVRAACLTIEAELEARYRELLDLGKVVEAERLLGRVRCDLDLLRENGHCSGIENYSRHFTGRKPGERPYCLLDYFRDGWLLIIDESHVTLPQVRGMYHGDYSRKRTLVDYGFRLPSALDNRPMKFDEFERFVPRALYVSATPAPYELERCAGVVSEQIIRPTGLVDPAVEVRPTAGQIPDLLNEIRARAARGERALVTTLTKRLAEEVAEYFQRERVKCCYLHSEIKALERVEILRDLRMGRYDAVVGVNLLREGLDLPEVSLVAILDADKEGFLRSATSLIQTIGRSARHAAGRVILYADTTTDSMRRALDETARRRALQTAYNEEHGITPVSIQKAIKAGVEAQIAAHTLVRETVRRPAERHLIEEEVFELERQMYEAAEALEFERAALLRDRIQTLRGETGSKLAVHGSRSTVHSSRQGPPNREPRTANRGGKGRGGEYPPSPLEGEGRGGGENGSKRPRGARNRRGAARRGPRRR